MRLSLHKDLLTWRHMGRRIHRADAPQRRRHDSRREVRMAANAERPKPFGIRRQLSDESQRPIVKLFGDYWSDGVIHEDIIPRMSLHVTEMPMSSIDAQLKRGLVLGYEFGRKATKLCDSFKEATQDTIEIKLGGADVFKGRNFGFRVVSEQLEEEYYGVRELMGNLGIKGTMRNVSPLHVTCGERDPGTHVGKSAKTETLDAMNNMLEDIIEGRPAVGDFVLSRTALLLPIDFYPDN